MLPILFSQGDAIVHQRERINQSNAKDSFSKTSQPNVGNMRLEFVTKRKNAYAGVPALHPSRRFKHSACSQFLRELNGHLVVIYGPSSTTVQQSDAMIQDCLFDFNWQPMIAMTAFTFHTFLQ